MTDSPSLKRWSYFIAIIIGLGFWHYPANDPDLGWHLFGGAWIFNHGRLPTEDVVNTFNKFWHDYHWLGQIVLYKIFTLAGYDGLRIALALVMAALSKVLLDIIYISMERQQSVLLAMVFYLASITLINAVTSIRIQMLAVLIIALTLRRLIQKPTASELPWLFFLSALLVNIHVYWVLIPMLWFFYRCVPRLAGERNLSPAYVWGGALLLGLAGLISPYGIVNIGYHPPFIFMNYAVILDYLRMPAKLRDTIGEFTPTILARGITSWIWFGLFILIIKNFRWRHIKNDSGNLLTALIFAYESVRAIKFVSLFAVGSLPYILKHITPSIYSLSPRAFKDKQPLNVVILTFLTAMALWYTLRGSPWLNNNEGFIHQYCPVHACEAIARAGIKPSSGRSHIRVLTHFNHGGWCRWILYLNDPEHDYRVTTDGRTQAVAPETFYESFDLYRARNNWAETLNRYDPDVALVSKSSALVQFMIRDPSEWKLLYHDNHFAVFLPLKKQ